MSLTKGILNKSGIKILHIKVARRCVPEDIAKKVSKALQNGIKITKAIFSIFWGLKTLITYPKLSGRTSCLL